MKCAMILTSTLVLVGSSAFAQDYVGDQACSGCHMNALDGTPGFFAGYANSGHPYKLNYIGGLEPAADAWPNSAIPPLPIVNGVQLQWSDIEYIIGNFYWKARFIDRDGYIYTGQADETTQWNLATETWSPYHAGEVDKPYNCGKCHTTGYVETGNQGNLPGLIGTWAQPGIRCEACHGPASEHVDTFGGTPPPGGKDCAECHFRDAQMRMPWKGGFMRHHQQAEDFSHSPHKNFVQDCMSCHDPHKSVVYNDGGMTRHCSDCHDGDFGNSYYAVAGMESVDCMDCHMPFMGKSAVAFNEYTGDIRGHLFRIMTEPIAAADNVYDDGGTLFWNQDVNGDAAVTLDYACLGCHIDAGPPLTLEGAAVYAADIHVQHAAFTADLDGDGIVASSDFMALLDAWGPCPEPCLPKCDGDLDGDCVVGIRDFLALIGNWTLP